MSQRIEEPRGRHLAEYRRLRSHGLKHRWQGLRTLGKVTAIVAVIVLAGALALSALFMIRSAFTGSVSSAVYQVHLASASAAPGEPCSAARVNGDIPPYSFGQLSITWAGVVPDDQCTLTGLYHGSTGAPNSGDLRVQALVLPAGVTALANGWCGATLAPTTLPGNPVAVTLTLVSNGAAAAFNPALHGLVWVRASEWVDDGCAGL